MMKISKVPLNAAEATEAVLAGGEVFRLPDPYELGTDRFAFGIKMPDDTLHLISRAVAKAVDVTVDDVQKKPRHLYEVKAARKLK